VGFWTPDYLEAKLRRLRAADLDRFILCIDEERNCSADELPHRAQVLRYRRRIDAAEVLGLIEPTAAGRSQPLRGSGSSGCSL